MADQPPPEEQQQPVAAAAQEPHFLPLVSAGETDHDSSDQEEMKLDDIPQKDDSDEEKEEEEESYWRHGDPDHMKQDELYDANMDDENEAWVYKHKRGGVEEAVTIARPATNSSNNNNNKLERAKMLKPRNSDAVLSCPCCFEIVCMDCQQHERYLNQYRAMFVMNIRVDWKHELVYSPDKKGLIDHTPTAGPTNHVPSEQENPQIYYSVHCNSCQTQVAALDMKEEIYHFFGCLSSA